MIAGGAAALGASGCLVLVAEAAALAYEAGVRLICGGVVLPFPFLPHSLRATSVKSPSSTTVGCGPCGASLLFQVPASSHGLYGAWASPFCTSGLLTGGGIENISSASSRASILVSTEAVRVAASGCSGAPAVLRGSICGGLPSSGSVLSTGCRAGAFFLG